ncbi:MAG: hydrogenase accessory protein HypB, partial [Anaerolineales bacterium]|nr:hydrogenase accessory protein HypB [Anaerolineales bacterium]
MSKTVPIVEQILSANDQIALQNRSQLDASGIFTINLMASPGAGKTSLIMATIQALQNEHRIGYIDGDIASSIDA